MDFAKRLATKLVFSSFTPECIITSGSILKLKDGSIKIVGDVNKILGVCDDCTDFGKDEITEIAHMEQLL